MNIKVACGQPLTPSFMVGNDPDDPDDGCPKFCPLDGLSLKKDYFKAYSKLELVHEKRKKEKTMRASLKKFQCWED